MTNTKIQQSIKAGKQSNNKQYINIIIDSLRKKKRRAKKPAPPPDREAHTSEPDRELTIDDIAQTVKPQMFYPTNVITVNPYGAKEPTMFDLSRQNELNTIMNQQETMRNTLEDMKMNMEPMIKRLIQAGMPQKAESIAQSLTGLTDILMRSPEEMSEVDRQNLFDQLSSVNSLDEYASIPTNQIPQSEASVNQNPLYSPDFTPQQAPSPSPSVISENVPVASDYSPRTQQELMQDVFGTPEPEEGYGGRQFWSIIPPTYPVPEPEPEIQEQEQEEEQVQQKKDEDEEDEATSEATSEGIATPVKSSTPYENFKRESNNIMSLLDKNYSKNRKNKLYTIAKQRMQKFVADNIDTYREFLTDPKDLDKISSDYNITKLTKPAFKKITNTLLKAMSK